MKYAAFLLILCGCISSSQWQTFKSHAAETGIATLGGGLAVYTGGVAGLAIAGGGMATGALVGELNRPPPAEVHTTTTVDEKGRIIDQKTTRTEAKTMPDTGIIHSITSWFDAFWKIAAGIIVLVYLVTHPKAVSAIVGIAVSGAQLAKNAAKTAQKAIHPIATKKSKK